MIQRIMVIASLCLINGACQMKPRKLDAADDVTEATDQIVIEPAARATSLNFSPDGGEIICGHWDGSVRAYDCRSGKERWNIKVSDSYVHATLAGDGKHVIVKSDDSTFSVWNLQSKARVSRFATRAIRATPIAKELDFFGLSLTTNSVLYFDTKKGESQEFLSGDDFNCLVSSSNGSSIATHKRRDSSVQIWDRSSKREIARLDGMDSSVNAIDLSSDGKRLVTGDHYGIVRVWDVQTKRPIRKFQSEYGVFDVVFSPDGRYVVAGTAVISKRLLKRGGNVYVWDINTGKLLFLRRTKSGSVLTVAISPDGKQFAYFDVQRIVLQPLPDGVE